jgi:hypothetical protein
VIQDLQDDCAGCDLYTTIRKSAAWTTALLACAACGEPVAAASPVSAPTASLDLGAPVAELRASDDGSRALALLSPTPGAQPDTLKFIDLTSPAAPRLRGSVATNASQLELSPDGRHAITVTTLARPTRQEPGRFEVVSWDLSDSDHPRSVLTTQVTGSEVTLAQDANAFAVLHPEREGQKKGQIEVRWLDGLHENSSIEVDHLFTAGRGGRAVVRRRSLSLAYRSFGILVLLDLRSAKPAVYVQEFSFVARYACGPTLLADGRILVGDARVPRLDVYAPVPRLPRIATLSLQGELCERPLGGGVRSDDVVLKYSPAGVEEWSVPQAGSPAVREWLLPADEAAIAASNHWIYAVTEPQVSLLHLFPRGIDASPVVDWTAHYAHSSGHHAALRVRARSGQLGCGSDQCRV